MRLSSRLRLAFWSTSAGLSSWIAPASRSWSRRFASLRPVAISSFCGVAPSRYSGSSMSPASKTVSPSKREPVTESVGRCSGRGAERMAQNSWFSAPSADHCWHVSQSAGFTGESRRLLWRSCSQVLARPAAFVDIVWTTTSAADLVLIGAPPAQAPARGSTASRLTYRAPTDRPPFWR
jgi:hypothetical protein